MAREKKAEVIDRLQKVFARSNVNVLTEYRGLSTAEMTVLRRRFREAGVEYKVVKNSLARFAADKAGKGNLVSALQGPLAIAFGYGDVTEPARILLDYIRTSKASLSIKGGLLGNRRLTAEEVTTLATLPSREILLSKVLGGMQSPIAALLGALSSPMSGFINILQARIKQLEEEQNAGK